MHPSRASPATQGVLIRAHREVRLGIAEYTGWMLWVVLQEIIRRGRIRTAPRRAASEHTAYRTETDGGQGSNKSGPGPHMKLCRSLSNRKSLFGPPPGALAH